MKNEVLYTVIVGTCILFVLGGFIIAFFLTYIRRKNKFIEEKQLLQLQFQETLLQSQIEIQEQTLRHISRELHDNLGQVASLIKINLNTLDITNPGHALNKIEYTKDLTRQLIADLKALSVRLGSERISHSGLQAAIEAEVERLNRTDQFTASLEIQGNLPELDSGKLVILYRMVQEVLNNTVKHSQAKHINIVLAATEKLFILVLKDDGIGFNAEEKSTGHGAGLANLATRAQLIKARLHLRSSPGTGTEISIELPL